MLKIAVVGASGRMGKEILQLATELRSHVVVAGVSRTKMNEIPHSSSSISNVPAAEVQTVIDFSQPELFEEVVQWCVKNKRPLVSGVTGISDQQKKTLTAAAQSIPILWAPNMSLGVAVMAEMFASLKALKGFEFQLEEIHHKHKKDRPSGTALFLQEKLKEVVGNVPEPLVMRGGGVFGIHKLFALGEEEVITIEHTATNRKVFARGALHASSWLQNKPPGLYKMADVLRT